MVEPMVKLTLLFRPAVRESFVSELQKFGVVHVEQQQVEENAETNRLAARIARIGQHQTFLRSRVDERGATPASVPYQGKIDDLVRKIDLLRVRIEGYETERAVLVRELATADRWGNFDPQLIEGLSKFGLRMSVHSATLATASRIAEEMTGDGTRSFVPLFEDKGTAFFAVVGSAESEAAELSVPEERLPERTASVVRERLEKIDEGIAEARSEIDALLPFREALSTRIAELQNELSFKIVVGSVHDAGEGHLYFLTGWIPSNQRGRLEEFLQSEEAAYLLEDPLPEDKVPVKLHNGAYTRLFEPILRIFSIPNYRELDPTPFFAPFYTIFFGLCVADLGYGVLILVAALVAFVVIKRKSVRPLLYLGLILATSVIVFGLLLNDLFGIKITSIAGPKSALSHAVLFGSVNSAMMLAITLGIIQITFGYVLRAINQVRAHGPAAALKPSGIILMLLGIVLAALHSLGPSFTVGPIPFGAAAAAIPAAQQIGFGMIGAGLVLLLLFNSLEKKIFLRPLFGLWELYELATTVPGYILSYLRLFALGLSGALLGETVINLAVMVRGDAWWGIFPMILVLLIGSGVNLAIGLLSAFVHSLRLTFVEFYNSVGFKGGGVEYRPFELKS
ncbi:MAG TPA: V-type ATPase 116kDa subunit family protein [Spirochaetia bacterium]|nr:V-type ATPase 116kDa subunit family protein [Spirochaetia bacterium]